VTSFLLVHGGADGAWCWDRLVPFLRSDSRVKDVVAIDLAGHGERSGELSSLPGVVRQSERPVAAGSDRGRWPRWGGGPAWGRTVAGGSDRASRHGTRGASAWPRDRLAGS
jgi:hypothetical protein